MKKSELKNIIKECVREVIFEEGMLSGIISEVVQGLGTHQTLQEVSRPLKTKMNATTERRVSETKKKMLDAVAENAYSGVKDRFKNPEFFEGTQPLREGNALAGTSPGDPGVDISNIPGFGNWASVVSSTRKQKNEKKKKPNS